MLLQGKDCWEPLEDGKRQGEVLSYSCQRECGLADTLFLDFRHPELKENGFRFLGHLVCGDLSWHP